MFPVPEFKVRCIKLRNSEDTNYNNGMEVGDVMDAWGYFKPSNCIDVLTKTGVQSALFDGEFEFITEQVGDQNAEG